MIVGTTVVNFIAITIAGMTLQMRDEGAVEQGPEDFAPFTAMSDGIPVCDDGQRAYVSKDRPRWSCEIEGCMFSDRACNHDENSCYDEHGNWMLGEDELCPHLTTRAKGAWGSFKNFLFCDGSYYCLDHNAIGLCIESVCLEEIVVDPELEF